MSFDEIELEQKEFCKQSGYEFSVALPDSKLGFAIETNGLLPINGLRHPPSIGTNGWYIWCGESFSESSNFFSPLHTIHIKDYCPEIVKFLGLPPGCRFLVAGSHVDIWYDDSLLNI
jgi:hypothetical protein